MTFILYLPINKYITTDLNYLLLKIFPLYCLESKLK